MSLITRNPGEYSVLTAFLEPGEEVIMFEPFFDQYLATVVFNGGIPVYVPLHPDRTVPKPTGDDWKIDFDELRYITVKFASDFSVLTKYAAPLSLPKPR